MIYFNLYLALNRIKQKEALLRLEDIELLNGKESIETYKEPSHRSSTAVMMTNSDSEPDTILSRLKKENIWGFSQTEDDCPQTGEEDPVSDKVVLSGYDTDEIEEEKDQAVYLTKIKEKLIYSLDNQCKFSEAFTDLCLKEFVNLDLSEEYQAKILELVGEEEQELDTENLESNLN